MPIIFQYFMTTDSSVRGRMFLGSCLALITTAMSFAIRGDIMEPLGTQFVLNKEQIGWVAGTAFWGFTVSIVIGGPLCDWLGMGRILRAAWVLHLVGILGTIFAQGYASLFAATLAIGMANGAVEAACNPLVTTLYPEDKSKKLNQFHVWFPGGIVIGGLLSFLISSYAFGKTPIGWQIKMATMLVPLACYGLIFFGLKFPQTERKAAGVSTGEMWKNIFSPLFLIIFGCMWLTASTELGTTQWITDMVKATMTNTDSGILVLVWISGLMALGRQFAGPVVHSLSPTGVLLFSAVFSAIGLVWMSYAEGLVMTFAAAAVFAVGVCYFWPTMLGFVAERCPKSGALGLALMGGAGMLSVSFILPAMGHIYDQDGPHQALRMVSILPGILFIVFGAMFLYDRAHGGYKVEKLGPS